MGAASRTAGIAAGGAAVAALVALATSLGGCGVGDQLCTPDSNLGDKADDCPYGPPGGPKPPVSECAEITQKSAAECMTPKTWTNDVFPIFGTTAPGTGACGIATCHGDMNFYNRVYLPPEDPQKSFDALTSYEGSQKYPYVNAKSPKDSWILCNLQDPPGVGQVMPSPPGVVTPEQIDIIREWMSCGAKFDGGSGSGGGGSGSGGGGGGGG